MTAKDIIAFWRESAKEDWAVAGELFELKRHHHALFFCHLAIEKLLKGLVYKNTMELPKPIHDLKKIAIQANVTLSPEQQHDFDEMTSWNINARYDSYKVQFYKKATGAYAATWSAKAKEVFRWLSNQY